MLLTVQRLVHDSIAAAARRRFGLADVPPFAIEVPPSRALGDLSAPIAFQLARTLRRPPRAIAQDLAADIGAIPGVARRSCWRACAAKRRRSPAPPARRSSSTPPSTRTRRRTSATCATRRSATRSCGR